MRIAVLGWGSLLWDRGGLNILPKESPGNAEFDAACDWFQGGPILPLEFSRISRTRSGALTLVIDEANGMRLPVWFAVSAHNDLNAAIRNLREREGTVPEWIGYAKYDGHARPCDMSDELLEKIFLWLQDEGFNAVIWTGLNSNFKNKTGQDFTVDAALDYLRSLDGTARKLAEEYILKSPKNIQTQLRMNARRILGWKV